MMLDALVVGAGPAGAVTALALRQSGWRVAIWDQREVPERRVGECLPARAEAVLRDVGLPQALRAGPHRRHPGQLVLWERDVARTVDGLEDPFGLGWHLHRPTFECQLREAALKSGVPLQQRRFAAAVRRGSRWCLVDTEGRGAEARLLVDATGRQAQVANHLGSRRRVGTRLVALVQWRRQRGGDQRTLIEATENGWWYSAPTTNGERVVTFHARAPLAREARATWETRLNATRLVAPRVADPVTRVTGCDASEGASERLGGPGWLTVGDAAMSFDPLSSRGLFHALYTGLKGARALDAALQGDPGPGLAYGREMAEVRRRYRHVHQIFMRMVQRWPNSPFWSQPAPRPICRTCSPDKSGRVTRSSDS